MSNESPRERTNNKDDDKKLNVAIIGGIFVVIAACIGAIGTIGDDIIAYLLKRNDATQTPTSQVTFTVTNTDEFPESTNTPTNLPPQITVTNTPSPSPTIIVTNSPTITNTSTITPTATYINPEFSDNFDDGADSIWENVTGSWRVINGMYTADRERRTVYSLIGDKSWKNYAIDVDVSSLCQTGYPVVLLLNSVDIGNGMQMEVNCCEIKWVLYENGESTIIANERTGIDFSGGCGFNNWIENHIRVETENNFYRVFVDGVKLLDVQDNTYDRGKSGIGLQCPPAEGTCPRFDNFNIEPLN